MGAEPRSTVCADSRKRLAGLAADLELRIELRRKDLDAGAAGLERLSARKAPAWTERKHGPVAGMAVVRVEFALEELADEDGLSPSLRMADDVADEDLSEARGETRREVADLVGVREDDECRVELLDELLEADDVAVGGVGLSSACSTR